MTDNPLVLIIMTSYNYGGYIGAGIQSVLDQTWTNWVLSICDDGSTDASVERIRAYDDERIHLQVNETNLGAAKTYAKAAAFCEADYYCCLDSDDLFEPDKLSQQLAFMEANPQVDILGTYIKVIDESGEEKDDEAVDWFNRDRDLNDPANWLLRNYLCHSSAMVRKQTHEQHLPDNSYVYTGDYELWLRCLIAGAKFAVLPEALTRYRVHAKNVTRGNARKMLLEHAFIAAGRLHPHLLALDRRDLLYRNIINFMLHEAFSSLSTEEKIRVLGCLTLEAAPPEQVSDMLAARDGPAGESLSASLAVTLYETLETRFEDQLPWIKELEKSKEAFALKVEELTAWAKELQNYREYLESQIRSKDEAIEELRESNSQAVKALEGELSASGQRLSAAESQARELEEQLAAQKAENSELAQKLEDVLLRINQLEADLLAGEQRLSEAESRERALEEQLAGQKAENSGLAQKLEDNLRRIKELEADLLVSEQRAADADELHELVRNQDGEIIRLRRHADELSLQAQQLRDSLTYRFGLICKDSVFKPYKLPLLPLRLGWLGVPVKIKNRVERRLGLGPGQPRSAPAPDSGFQAWPANRPLVSVIIPCFNHGDYLAEAVASVSGQTWTRLEIIVVDDGSTDEKTLQAFRGLEESGIKVIHQPNRGLPAARNAGIARAAGKYACCLDADDLIEPTYLEKALFLLESQVLDVVTPLQRNFEQDSDVEDPGPATLKRLLQENCLVVASVFSRELWERAGGYDEAMTKGYEDWEFWIRAFAAGARPGRLPEPLFLYRKHGASMIDDARAAHGEITAYIHEKHRDLIKNRSSVARLDKQRVRPLKGRLDNLIPAGGDEHRLTILLSMPWLALGGAETYLSRLLAPFVWQGLRLLVATTRKQPLSSGDGKPLFQSLTKEIYFLPDFLEEGQWKDFLDYLAASRRVDLVLQAGSEAVYGMLEGLKAAHPGLAVADMIFNTEGHAARNREYGRFIDLTIAESGLVREWLIEHGAAPDQVALVPNGVDTQVFKPRPKSGQGPFVAAFIGRFSLEKGADRFLKLADRFRDRPDISFVMAGQGPLEDDIRSQALEAGLKNLTFAGQVDTAEWLGGCDAVLLPSLMDGRPNILLEAMACGIPVLASPVGDVPGVINSGENGFICVDLDQFQEHLAQLADSPGKAAEIGSRARQTALKTLDISTSRSMFMEAVQGLVAAMPGLADDARPGFEVVVFDTGGDPAPFLERAGKWTIRPDRILFVTEREIPGPPPADPPIEAVRPENLAAALDPSSSGIRLLVRTGIDLFPATLEKLFLALDSRPELAALSVMGLHSEEARENITAIERLAQASDSVAGLSPLAVRPEKLKGPVPPNWDGALAVHGLKGAYTLPEVGFLCDQRVSAPSGFRMIPREPFFDGREYAPDLKRLLSLPPEPEKILILAPWLPVGGAEMHLFQVSEAMRDLGYLPVILLTELMEYSMGDMSLRFVRSVTPYVYHLDHTLPRAAWDGLVRELLSRYGIRKMFLQGSSFAYSMLPAWSRDFPGLSVADQLFNADFEYGHIRKNCENQRHIAFSFGVTSIVEKEIKARNPKAEAHTIHTGIETGEALISRYDPAGIKKRLGLPGDRPIVSFVGRMSQEKNPQTFLEVAKAFPDAPDAPYFIMVGHGPLLDDIRGEIKRSKIKNLLFMSLPEDVHEIFAVTDVIVNCSHVEALSLVLTEAMAHGTAVIARDVGDQATIVREGQNGFLCAGTRAQEYIDALSKVLDDPALIPEAKAVSREIADDFDVKRMQARYREIFIRHWGEGRPPDMP